MTTRSLFSELNQLLVEEMLLQGLDVQVPVRTYFLVTHLICNRGPEQRLLVAHTHKMADGEILAAQQQVHRIVVDPPH